MKIRKYIYFVFLMILLILTTSCSMLQKYQVNIYDGNGNIIETLSVKEGFYIDLGMYGIPEKDSDEVYDYYFTGWNTEDTFKVTKSIEIHPNFEKYPAGLNIYTQFRIGYEEDEYSKEKYKFYYVSSYTGTQSHFEIPEKIGYPLSKDKKIKEYFPVKIITEEAFMGNKNIEEVVLPEGITRIGQNAFKNCTNLKKINIPSSVTYIQTYAFLNSGLTKITIPGSVSTIGAGAFKDCDSLTEVIFEENDSLFYESALFKDCENLVEVTLPDSLSFIENDTFHGCVNLEIINTNSKIYKVGSYAFSGCEKLDLSFIDFSILESVGECSFSDCTTVPSKLDMSNLEYTSTSFSGCTSIEELIFSANTTEILGFDNCINLSYINFSDLPNLTRIDGLANIKMSKFDLSNNEKLNEFRSYGAPLFDEIILHHDIKKRPDAKKVTILNGEIVEEFSSDIEEVVLPKDLKEIPASTFSKCENLKSITIPASVESIGENAFGLCIKLEQVIFEKNSLLEIIGENAFLNCYELYDINIGECKKLETIEDKAFKNCNSLINFEFEQIINLRTIGNDSFLNTNIRIMKLPTKLTKLGTGLPTLLSFVYIPNTLSYPYTTKNTKIVFANQGYLAGATSNVHNSIDPDKIYYDNDGFVYYLGSNNKAAIVRYCGIKRDVVTPESITVNNVTYVVEEIYSYAFGGDFVTSLKISDSIKHADYFFSGLENSKLQKEYINLRILSVGTNFESYLITKYEEKTGLGIKEGYTEYWYSQFNVINSYLDYENNTFTLSSNRYQPNNLISAENLNDNSKVIIGTKMHVYSITYDTYPSYKEYYNNYTIDRLSNLNDSIYDIEYVVVDNFIFNIKMDKCLGYLGDYQTNLVLPKLENEYECHFILNEYHCYTYEVPENVTLIYN